MLKPSLANEIQVAALPERQRILSCLNQIRRRLWTVRLAERLAAALAWGAVVAIAPTAARLLRDRYPIVAGITALLPLAIAGWAWWSSERRHSLFPFTPSLLRILAVLSGVVAILGEAAIFVSVASTIPVWAFAIAPIVIFLVAAAVTTRRIDARAAAIFVDQQVGLQERVATALEMLSTAPASIAEQGFRQPVIASAMAACGEMRRARVGYARADQRLYAVAATAAIVAVGMSLVNPLPARAKESNRPYLAVVDKSRKLEDLLKQMEEKKIPQNDVTQQKLKPLQEALTDLRKGNMSPFEAQERLAEAKGALQREQDPMEAAEKVAKALENIKDAEQVAEAGNRLKDANVKGANGASGSGAAKDAAKQGLRDAAQALGDKVKGDGMSQSEKEKLAGDLKKAAGEAGGDPQLKQDLDKAAEAAQKGDGDQLAQSLGAAGERMANQQADHQMSGDSVREAMAAIDRANNGDRSGDEARAQAGSASNGGQSGEQQNGGQQGDQQAGGQQGGQQNGQQNGRQQNQQGTGQQASSGTQGGGQGSQQSSGQQSGKSGSAQGPGGSPMADSGSTNLHSPGGPGDHSQGRPLGGVGEFVKVYDENPIASQGRTEKVSGKINPLGPAAGTAEVFGQADKKDATIKTYESTIEGVRKKALDDLQTQQIPPKYRDLIRDYYAQ